MPEEITVSYKYELKECIWAAIFHFINNFLERVVYFLMVIYAMVCWYFFGFHFVWLILICFPVLFLLVIGLASWIRYLREPRCKDILNLRFSDDAIYFKTDHVDSKIEWRLYKKILENKRMFLLYYGKECFTIVPKRVFKDKNQEEIFRNLIHRKIQ